MELKSTENFTEGAMIMPYVDDLVWQTMDCVPKDGSWIVLNLNRDVDGHIVGFFSETNNCWMEVGPADDLDSVPDQGESLEVFSFKTIPSDEEPVKRMSMSMYELYQDLQYKTSSPSYD